MTYPILRAIARAADGTVFVGAEQATVGADILYVASGGVLTATALPDSSAFITVCDFTQDADYLYCLAVGPGGWRVYRYAGSAWATYAEGDIDQGHATTLCLFQGALYVGTEQGLLVWQRYAWRLVQTWMAPTSRLRAYGDTLLADAWRISATGAEQPINWGAPSDALFGVNTVIGYGGAVYALMVTDIFQGPARQSLLRLGASGIVETVASWDCATSGFYWSTAVMQGQLVMCGGLPVVTNRGGAETSTVTVTGCLGYWNGTGLLLAQPSLLMATFATSPGAPIALSAPGSVSMIMSWISNVGAPSDPLSIAGACQEMIAWGGNRAFGMHGGGLNTNGIPPTEVFFTPPSAGVDWIQVEWSDGSGAATAAVDWLEVEWANGAFPPIASVDWMQVEWSDGSGAATAAVDFLQVEWDDGGGQNTAGIDWVLVSWGGQTAAAEVDWLQVEWSDGSGAATAAVDWVQVEWHDGSGTNKATVDWIEIAWANGPPPPSGFVAAVDWVQVGWATGPPVPTGGVRYLHYLGEALQAAIRIVPDLELGPAALMRVFVRAEAGQPLDDWESYQEIGFWLDYTLETPASDLTIALVPYTGQTPDLSLVAQFRPEN